MSVSEAILSKNYQDLEKLVQTQSFLSPKQAEDFLKGTNLSGDVWNDIADFAADKIKSFQAKIASSSRVSHTYFGEYLPKASSIYKDREWQQYQSYLSSKADEYFQLVVMKDPIWPTVRACITLLAHRTKDSHGNGTRTSVSSYQGSTHYVYYKDVEFLTFYGWNDSCEFHNFRLPFYYTAVKTWSSSQYAYREDTESKFPYEATNIHINYNFSQNFAQSKILVFSLYVRENFNKSDMCSFLERSLEITRLYYHLHELHDEENELTKRIAEKREILNSLSEDILARKLEMKKVEAKFIETQNELDRSIAHLKQFEISNEIAHEISFQRLSLEEQHLLEAKDLHEYYVHFADELKLYKLVFSNVDELAMKLMKEQAEKEAEIKQREEELKAKEEVLEKANEEFKKTIEQFDSKMKKSVDNFEQKNKTIVRDYPKYKSTCEKQAKEIESLKAQLTNEKRRADAFKQTIDVIKGNFK